MRHQNLDTQDRKQASQAPGRAPTNRRATPRREDDREQSAEFDRVSDPYTPPRSALSAVWTRTTCASPCGHRPTRKATAAAVSDVRPQVFVDRSVRTDDWALGKYTYFLYCRKHIADCRYLAKVDSLLHRPKPPDCLGMRIQGSIHRED